MLKMNLACYSALFLVISAEFIVCQITDTYTCVPASLCPGNGNGTIDPRALPNVRIVAPTSATTTTTATSIVTGCPSGYVACTTLPRCGVPSVQPIPTNGPATNGTFPWLAYLTDSSGNYLGGGMLLDPYHVLTAAHKTNVTGMNVYMGVYNPSTISSNVRSRVLCVRRNDNYNNSTLRNDIAILRLETPLTGSGILTGCLPSQGASFVGSTCVVAGWGKTNFTTQDAPTTLRQVFVPIVTMSQCVASYNNILGSNTQIYLDQQMEICAGGVQGIDACTMDGGSPLMCFDGSKYVAAGLVIWGKNCALANVYGVYVSVPSYRNWINEQLTCLNTNNQNPSACNCHW